MRRLLASFAMLVPVLVVSACGSSTNDEDGPDPQVAAASRSAAADERAAAEREARREADQALYEECRGTVQPLLRALQEVDSRLAVGLTQTDYGTLLGDARVVYDRAVTNIVDKGARCLRVGRKLEQSLNVHVQVLNEWGDCIGDYDCDFSTGEIADRTQERWARTGTLATEAQTNLEAIAP